MRDVPLAIGLLVGADAGAQTKTFVERLPLVPLTVAMQEAVGGVGSATAVLNGDRLTIEGKFDGLKSPATIARLHVAPRGLRGPAIADVTVPSATSGVFKGIVTLNDRQREALEDGATLIVPPGALPEGTEVEAHRLSVEAAPDTPDELGSVRALYRFGTSRPPDAPLLIQVPIPEVEQGTVLEFRHHGPEGWTALPVARHDGLALVWTESTSPFAWLETDPATLTETQRRTDLEQKVAYARANAPVVPGYLLDPDTFATAVTGVWGSFAEWAGRHDLTLHYDGLWLTGSLLDSISTDALGHAGAALTAEELDRAEKLLDLAQRYRLWSHRAFEAASALFQGDEQTGVLIADEIRTELLQEIPGDLPIDDPRAASVSARAWTAADHAVGQVLPDGEQGSRTMLAGAITKTLLDGVEFDELGGRSILAWIDDQPAQEVTAFLEPLLDRVAAEDVVREVIARVGEGALHEVAGLLDNYALGVWREELDTAGYTARPLEHRPVSVFHPQSSRVPHDEEVFGGPGSQRMRAVTAWGRGLVAVGQDCFGLECVAAVWATSDGEPWSRVPHDNTALGGPGPQRKWMWGLTTAGPGLVAVGWDCSWGDCVAAAWTSSDGVVWTRVPHDEEVFGGPGNQRMVSVTAGGPGVIAVGWDRSSSGEDARAAVWTSPDGVTWSRVPHDEQVFGGPEDQVMWSVTTGGPGVVAVGYAGSLSGDSAQAAVWTSPVS